MKADTHPIYYTDAIVTCSCGNKMRVGGTVKKINVEICSACHPFFTGEKRIMDTAGRVEKFNQRSTKSKIHNVKPKNKKRK